MFIEHSVPGITHFPALEFIFKDSFLVLEPLMKPFLRALLFQAQLTFPSSPIRISIINPVTFDYAYLQVYLCRGHRGSS